MTVKYFFASLTRISNLPEVPFFVEPLPREEWETGDYVVGKVDEPPSDLSRVELGNGRNVEVIEGDLVVGAFGKRHATLAAVGEWQNIGDDLRMESLTGAGLFGKATSETKRHLSFTYEGHVFVDSEKAVMRDFVPPTPDRSFEVPVILLLGTSMSAGKATSAKAIVRLLEQAGLRVIGAKLAGRRATATSSVWRTPGRSASSTSWMRGSPRPRYPRRSTGWPCGTSWRVWPRRAPTWSWRRLVPRPWNPTTGRWPSKSSART